MFSSITPSSDFLAILFIKSTSFNVLPAPNTSSKTILNASVTDALPPIQPLFKTKAPALKKLRLCVAGDKTVLPVCTPALYAIIDWYIEFCINLSSIPPVPLSKSVTSRDPYKFAIPDSSKPSPGTLPTISGLVTPAAMASSLDANNLPSLNSNSPILS